MSGLLSPGFEGKDKKLMPQGRYPAFLINIVNIGTQFKKPDAWHPEGQKQKQVVFTYEFPFNTDIFANDYPEPHHVSTTYNFVVGDQSKLRTDVIPGLLNRPLGSHEYPGGVYDIGQFIGLPVMVKIQHKESGGKIYANIVSADLLTQDEALNLRYDWSKFKPSRAPILFGVNADGSCFHDPKFTMLPDWLRKKCLFSDEGVAYVAKGGQIPNSVTQQAQMPQQFNPGTGTAPPQTVWQEVKAPAQQMPIQEVAVRQAPVQQPTPSFAPQQGIPTPANVGIFNPNIGQVFAPPAQAFAPQQAAQLGGITYNPVPQQAPVEQVLNMDRPSDLDALPDPNHFM